MFSDINLKNELIKTRKSSSTEFNLTEYYAVIEKEIPAGPAPTTAILFDVRTLL